MKDSSDVCTAEPAGQHTCKHTHYTVTQSHSHTVTQSHRHTGTQAHTTLTTHGCLPVDHNVPPEAVAQPLPLEQTAAHQRQLLSHAHSRAPAAHQYRHPIAHAQSQSHELWKASQRVCSRHSPVEHRSCLLLPGTYPIAALSSASSQLRLPPAVQLAGSVL